MKKTTIISDKDGLQKVAKAVLKRQVNIFLLSGEVGSGKTTLIKEILKANNSNELVTSPTFNIYHIYEDIYHYDLYNHSVDTLIQMGLLDWLSQDGRHFIEWGEKLEQILIHYGFKYCLIKITEPKNDINAMKEKRIYEFLE